MCSAKLSFSTVYSVELQASQEEILERELNSVEGRMEICCKRTLNSGNQDFVDLKNVVVELKDVVLEQSRQVVDLKNVVVELKDMVLGKNEQITEQGQQITEQRQQITEQAHIIDDLQKTVFVLNKHHVDQRDLKLLKIEQMVFIEENESMHRFSIVLRSHLISAFSSTFVLARGEVARSQKEWRDRLVQGFGIGGEIVAVLPHVRAIAGAGSVICTATRVLTTLMQAYLDQRNVNHAKSRIEIMIAPGKMEKQSEKVARKLCEMYEWQLSKLTVEGAERLAIHSITEILVFMLYGKPKSTSVQSFHRQWIHLLQERKRTNWDELKNSIAHLGSPFCLEFFQIYTDELSTVDDIRYSWKGLDLFSICGVRLKEGAYFTGESIDHQLYGYRIGGQEDIRNMQREQEVLKELSYIPTFPQLEDIQSSTFVPRRPPLETHQEQESVVVYPPSRIQSSWRASTHTVKRDFSSTRTYLVFRMVIDSRDETVVSYVSRKGYFSLFGRVTIIKDMEARSLVREKMSIENQGDLIITEESKVERIYARVRLEAHNPLGYPIVYNTSSANSVVPLKNILRIENLKLQKAYEENEALLREMFQFSDKYRNAFLSDYFLYFTRKYVHGGMVTVLDRIKKANEDEIFSHRLIGFNPISWTLAPLVGPALLHWESIRKEEFKNVILYLKVMCMAQKGFNAFGRILGISSWEETQGFPEDFFYDMEKYRLSDRLLAARDQVVHRFFRTFVEGIIYMDIRPHNSQTWAIDKLNSEI